MKHEKVSVFEVGARDGLQNEKRLVPLPQKIWFVSQLAKAGIQDLELGAFVRPDRVPQMADTEKLYAAIETGKLKLGRTRAWSLVPNLRGLERAIDAGVKQIALFTAASESFNKSNIGMSVAESLREIRDLMPVAKKHRLQVRGYVSTVFGCPFEGKVSPKKALGVIERLADLGVEQVSIGDTIGVATPAGVDQIIKPAMRLLGQKKVAVHFHDTRGTALANTLRSLEYGVRTVDSSAGGLGGCPFAPGAKGNLATEDLVYMLHGMGFRTGIQLDRLAQASLELAKKMKRSLTSRYLQAYASRRK
ncbi:hydroxymethylglutaryl-CoA lyase [bacterium]|jgi:isopropylmalate/homocitrate/citramalate synthase|nr:hydroxymethylglutaryl-CoA lyase [bacterium]